MKNGWIWVPVAGVLGLIVGAWGPREELREREKKAAEEKALRTREIHALTSKALEARPELLRQAEAFERALPLLKKAYSLTHSIRFFPSGFFCRPTGRYPRSVPE